jgi:hypothetical protein
MDYLTVLSKVIDNVTFDKIEVSYPYGEPVIKYTKETKNFWLYIYISKTYVSVYRYSVDKFDQGVSRFYSIHNNTCCYEIGFN